MPLILDGSNSVRTQLLKFLRLLQSSDVGDHVECVLLYTRAGITHLALEIRIHALETLEWLLEVAGDEVVSCPGGWVKTLKCLMSIMGWNLVLTTGKWTSTSKVTLGKAGKAFPRQLLVFAHFLKVGLIESDDLLAIAAQRKSDDLARNMRNFPVLDAHLNMIPTTANAYTHLNLFGAPRDEECEIYSDREARQRVFCTKFLLGVQNGVENSRKEGGEVGRAAAVLAEVIKKGTSDYCELSKDQVL
ncbi:hypothetical protein K3495_g11627 [Podosphaera aphanis]|nr:hypothetical protein K3495_g11627 [Podosphaera aphanis]